MKSRIISLAAANVRVETARCCGLAAIQTSGFTGTPSKFWIPLQCVAYRLEARIEILYTDPVGGRIRPAVYDAKASKIREQQQTVLRRIEQIQSGAPALVEDALKLMGLTSKAAAVLRAQNGQEQRRLLRTLMKTARVPRRRVANEVRGAV